MEGDEYLVGSSSCIVTEPTDPESILFITTRRLAWLTWAEDENVARVESIPLSEIADCEVVDIELAEEQKPKRDRFREMQNGCIFDRLFDLGLAQTGMERTAKSFTRFGSSQIQRQIRHERNMEEREQRNAKPETWGAVTIHSYSNECIFILKEGNHDEFADTIKEIIEAVGAAGGEKNLTDNDKAVSIYQLKFGENYLRSKAMTRYVTVI